SVGEVLAAKSLVDELERELPRHEIVLSTTTKTGQEVARKHYPGKRVFYYPLDFSFSTRRILRRVNPQAVILMELEIWPNFLLSTSATRVPVLLVNGRISRKSFGQYRVLQRVLPEPMDRILLYCVQTKTYGDRFLELGVRPDRVHVTGTMKFDNINTEGVESLRRKVATDLRLDPGDRVLMCGSTHPGEEEILHGIFMDLAREYPAFRLVVVPRHPERLADVEARLRKRGAPVVRKTNLVGMERVEGRPVILVDTMGELARMYAVAELVFVGGSLIPHGGQNMIEPAGLGRAVLFGPHTQNFQESVDILLDAGAAVRVRDAEDLRAAILHLAGNPGEAARMGDRARRAVIAQKAASRRIMELVRPCLTRAPGQDGGRETRES
ncbi:MAG: 3-deoxy-D-manno-octulosonic acid transferase, partial [Planctomycetes bacterium]|nr:3-deoxy-D-manno-octulosonic acid transferase [Planctomycetota bacterium]